MNLHLCCIVKTNTMLFGLGTQLMINGHTLCMQCCPIWLSYEIIMWRGTNYDRNYANEEWRGQYMYNIKNRGGGGGGIIQMTTTHPQLLFTARLNQKYANLASLCAGRAVLWLSQWTVVSYHGGLHPFLHKLLQSCADFILAVHQQLQRKKD